MSNSRSRTQMVVLKYSSVIHITKAFLIILFSYTIFNESIAQSMIITLRYMFGPKHPQNILRPQAHKTHKTASVDEAYEKPQQ